MKKGILQRLKEGPVLGDGGYLLELEKRGWVRAGICRKPGIKAIAGLAKARLTGRLAHLNSRPFRVPGRPPLYGG
jgi:hypothetical protein